MELIGRAVYPESPSYAEARADWDRLFSSYPRVIVFAENADDVVNAVIWARENEVELRVRGGRHCLEGWSNVSGGIVVDVSQMKSARLDPRAATVTVGAGLTQVEAVAALGERGFAVATGGEATVGLTGATLGGGLGFFTRNYGMVCDNLIAAEVVVASGGDGAQAIRVDRERNSDLLWALRGAGNGNFGIVTSLTYRMYPLTQVTLLRAKWSGFDDVQGVFGAWQQLAPATDRRLSSALSCGSDGMELSAILQSGRPEEARELLAPILSAGRPDVLVRAGSWVEIFAALQPPPDSPVEKANNWKFNSQFITTPFPAEAIDLVAKYSAAAPSAASDYFCSSLGGAMTEPPPGGSAFVHRDALFYAEPGAGWNGDEITPTALAWVAEFSEALRPHVNGAYVNVPNADAADWETAYWGEHYPRLREIKARYDPDNVFRYEQSVRPA
ncbi:MAG TPA: FAD-binding oxidoreductase [Solirubrobacteraceae bacterium]